MSKFSHSGFISLKVMITEVFTHPFVGINHFFYFPESFTAIDWVLDILIGEYSLGVIGVTSCCLYDKKS